MSDKLASSTYEEIKYVTRQAIWFDLVGKLNIPVKEHNEKKVQEIFEQFKSENPEVWDRFYEIYRFWDIEEDVEICAEEDSEELSEQEVLILTILVMLANCKMKFVASNKEDQEDCEECTEEFYLNSLEYLLDIFV